MNAVTISPERSLVVRAHPDPEPGVGQVLVRIRAAGINNIDLVRLAGTLQAPPGSPRDILGLELAGEVMAVGPSSVRFAVGDRVMGIVGGGAQAELLAVHERQLMPVPANLDWDQAGGFPEVFVTAHDALFTQAGLRVGERVLVTGAAGGVGCAAVQVAAAAGAEVVASVRDPASRTVVERLGAARVIDPGQAEAAGPYDVVLELVGAVNFDVNMRSLNSGGRIVIIGVGAGHEARLDFNLLAGKRATVRGSTMLNRSLEEKALATRAVEHQLLPLVAAGRITVPVAAVFPLADAVAAYDAFRASGKIGKVILRA